eukprot:gene28782-11797_t
MERTARTVLMLSMLFVCIAGDWATLGTAEIWTVAVLVMDGMLVMEAEPWGSRLAVATQRLAQADLREQCATIEAVADVAEDVAVLLAGYRVDAAAGLVAAAGARC